MSTELQKTEMEDTAIEVLGQYDYSDSVQEELDSKDLTTPILAIMQQISEKVSEGEANAGDLWNSVTKEAIPACRKKDQNGLLAIPVHRVRKYVEWRPRSAGGGQVAQYAETDPFVLQQRAKQPFGKIVLEDGNELIETTDFFVLLVEPDGTPVGPACIPMKSTQLGVLKSWLGTINTYRTPPNSKGRRVNPPMFAHTVRIQTDLVERNNHKWYNYVISPANDAGTREESITASLVPPGSHAFQAAKEMKEFVAGGNAKVDTFVDTEVDALDSDETPF